MKKYSLFFMFLCCCCLLGAKNRPVKVACVGNSITYGTGIAEREKYAYPVQLQQLLGDAYEVGNFGRPGATLLNKGHRPYQQQPEFRQALDFAGDIVVIHLGVNDTDPRNWPHFRDEFIPDYRALIDSFRVVNPKCRILIARLTPIADRHPRFESGTRDWHDQIQLAIEQVARYADVQLIDFHEPLYPYPYLLPDAIHSNAQGAALLARTVYEGITGDFGGLQLSEIYTDHMVLQREQPVRIEGKANAGEKVTVTFAGQKLKAVTGTNGKWSVNLQPMPAGGPYTLTVATRTVKKEFRDVLVGEVWLCSGQSNMEFYLNWSAEARQEVPQSTNDRIRLYDMKARWRTDARAWDASVLDSLNRLQYTAPTVGKPVCPKQPVIFRRWLTSLARSCRIACRFLSA